MRLAGQSRVEHRLLAGDHRDGVLAGQRRALDALAFFFNGQEPANHLHQPGIPGDPA